MQTESPVIRTYAGPDRAAAEAAFRADVSTARLAGWVVVAHRWRTEGDQHELSVVFEMPPPEAGAVAPEAEAVDGVVLPVSAGTGVPTGVGASAGRAHARATLETIDLHAGGEPIRLIRSGYPRVPSAPILERRRWVREYADGARQVLMYEPRGHRDMYGAVLLPPHRDDADIAVLFMHNEGYSTMCGHGVIALTTGLIEEGLYPATMPVTTIRWETPAGLVTARADVALGEDGGPEVRGVRFTNVPSYLHQSDIGVAVEGRGEVLVQLAFGGAYYGIVDAADLGLRVVPESIEALASAGVTITEALRRDHSPTHPTDADLGFVYGTIIVDHVPVHRAGWSGADRHDAQCDDLRRGGGGPVPVWLRHQRAAGLAARGRADWRWATISATRASRARCSRVGSMG